MRGVSETDQVNGCVYIVPWRGACGDTIVPSQDEPVCEEHAEKTCWCGAQAVAACSATDGLVCGQPVCEEHGCNQSFRTGGYHDDDGREQYEQLRAAGELAIPTGQNGD